jgi:hypothetical protein
LKNCIEGLTVTVTLVGVDAVAGLALSQAADEEVETVNDVGPPLELTVTVWFWDAPPITAVKLSVCGEADTVPPVAGLPVTVSETGIVWVTPPAVTLIEPLFSPFGKPVGFTETVRFCGVTRLPE